MADAHRKEIRVRWGYNHCLGVSWTWRVLIGTYLGKIRHTCKHWRKPGTVQLAVVHFDGNKRTSKVPFEELDFSSGAKDTP